MFIYSPRKLIQIIQHPEISFPMFSKIDPPYKISEMKGDNILILECNKKIQLNYYT